MTEVKPWFEMFFRGLKGEGITVKKGEQYLLVFQQRFNAYDEEELQEFLTSIESSYECKFLVLHGYGDGPSIYEGVTPQEFIQTSENVFEFKRKFRQV